MTKRVWVQWGGIAHLADQAVTEADVRNGDYPLACGRWAPSGWDATIRVASAGHRRCKRCEAKE